VKHTSYEAPLYAVFAELILLLNFRIQTNMH